MFMQHGARKRFGVDGRYAAKRAAEPYECSAHGCVNPTAGHYCAWHTSTCESCGDEAERGTTVRGLCDRCAARNCEYDREEVLMDCWCGCERHAGVR